MFKKVLDLFLNILSSEDPKLDALEKRPEIFWSNLCKLRKTPGDKIYFFDYQNADIKKSIDQIKHKRNRDILEKITSAIADQLLEELSELKTIDNFSPSFILPLPRSNNTKDFNHGNDIAKSIIKKIGSKEINNLKKVLLKDKKTTPQHHLKREERLKNLKNTMSVNKKYKGLLKDKDLILVDDVTTTGATFDEAVRALKDCGTKKIICVAIAH